MPDQLALGHKAIDDEAFGLDPLLLDMDEVVGNHIAVVANAGSGKSGLLRKIIEQTHGKIQQVLLDPEDELYTLRERCNFLIAGGDGDCPATPGNAALLATTFLQHDISAIVQLNSLRVDEQEAFVAIFLEAIMAAPRALWRPVMIGLDETQRWAPQEGRTMASDAVRDLSARGRKRGYTALLASQRIASIDKNVTANVSNWFFGRVGQATDRRVACDSLGFTPGSKEGRGMTALPKRVFWTQGVATTAEPTLFRVAATETTIVRSGQAKVPTPPAPAALAGLLAALAVPPAPPAAPSDPGGAPADCGAEAERARAEGEAVGLKEGRALALHRVAELLGPLIDFLAAEAEPRKPAPVVAAPAPHAPPAAPAAASPAVDVVVTKPAAQSSEKGAAGLLRAAALSHSPMTWDQVAFVAGRKASGGHWNTSRRRAITEGWLEDRADLAVVTLAGLAISGVPSHERVSPFWAYFNALDDGPKAVMNRIMDEPGLTPQLLAESLGRQARGGHWNATLATLRRGDLMVVTDGRIYPSPAHKE